MSEVLGRYHVVLLGWVLLLPVAVAVVLLRSRASGSLRYAVCEVAAVYGTLPWLGMTFTPDAGGARRIQPVPLRDLVDLVGAPAGTVAVQVIGNLLVFAAAGFCLPLRFAALRSLPRVVLLAALGSVVIETVQYAAGLGRVSSVDDVALNAIGAGVFALLSRPLWTMPARSAPGAGSP